MLDKVKKLDPAVKDMKITDRMYLNKKGKTLKKTDKWDHQVVIIQKDEKK